MQDLNQVLENLHLPLRKQDQNTIGDGNCFTRAVTEFIQISLSVENNQTFASVVVGDFQIHQFREGYKKEHKSRLSPPPLKKNLPYFCIALK